jgi:hypothetical protein
MFRFAIYVSNHGYGHATRMATLASEFIKFGIFIHIRSARPDFLFSDLNADYYRQEDVFCDVGVKHGKDLIPDIAATKSALINLMRDRLKIIEREVDFLRKEKIDLIIADVPWLVIEAGTYAKVPVVAISNFDWLFIYADLFKQDSRMRPVLNTIFGLYQRVEQVYRLPLSSSSSMGAFRKCEKVGLLVNRKESTYNLRKDHGLNEKDPILLCTFGGEGSMALDYDQLCKSFPGYVVSAQQGISAHNHVEISSACSFSDLIQNVDLILTKPGYSTFAEALNNGLGIIYYPRKDYPEEDVLIKGISLFKYPHKVRLDSLSQKARAWGRVWKQFDYSRLHSHKINDSNAHIAGLVLQRFMSNRSATNKLTSVYDLGSNYINYSLISEGTKTPLHVASIYTGLTINSRVKQNGDIILSKNSFSTFKKSFYILADFDHLINSRKKAIATGVHRKAVNAELISDWIQKRWKMDYRLLTQNEEAELASLAAGFLTHSERGYLVVDLGGFSTELSITDPQGKRFASSLDFGLTALSKAVGKGETLDSVLSGKLPIISPNPVAIVAVGLAGVYLSKGINKIETFLPEIFQNTTLTIRDLKAFLNRYKDTDQDPLSQDPRYIQASIFLKASAEFFAYILDHYHCHDLIISYYGISAVYPDWEKNHPLQKSKPKII